MLHQYTCPQCGKPFTRVQKRSKYDRFYCSISCSNKYRTGAESRHWKGGRTMSGGYVYLCMEGKQVPEHRVVMAQHLGRPLLSSEIIHHINGVKHDNRLENLMIVSRSEHPHLHAGLWSRKHSCCVVCGKTDYPHEGAGMCRICRRAYKRAHARNILSNSSTTPASVPFSS